MDKNKIIFWYIVVLDLIEERIEDVVVCFGSLKLNKYE